MIASSLSERLDVLKLGEADPIFALLCVLTPSLAPFLKDGGWHWASYSVALDMCATETGEQLCLVKVLGTFGYDFKIECFR